MKKHNGRISARAFRTAHAAALGCIIVLILAFAVMPGLPGGVNSGIAAHAAAYAMLCFVLLLFFQSCGAGRQVSRAVVCSFLYGIFIECVQYFVPYRSFELHDILVNGLGTLAGVVPGLLLTAYLPIYSRQQ